MEKQNNSSRKRNNRHNKSNRGKHNRADKRYNSSRPPYLGFIKLYWCPKENIPIFRSKICPHCGSKTNIVELTPPADFRPAFLNEIKFIHEIIDKDYGSSIGRHLFPLDKIIILNKIPALEFAEEIIMNGKIYGFFEYDPFKEEFIFRPKLEAARLIVEYQNKLGINKKRIKISKDAVPYILNGMSILAPGVIDKTDDIRKGDYCLILDEAGRYLSTGISLGDSGAITKMVDDKYGKVAKNIKKNIDPSMKLNASTAATIATMEPHTTGQLIGRGKQELQLQTDKEQ
ncbi:MAG: PUA domain-containing protein, partial [Promethearchaeota archaeon]